MLINRRAELNGKEFEILKAYYENVIRKFYITSIECHIVSIDDSNKAINIPLSIHSDKSLVEEKLITEYGLNEYFKILRVYYSHRHEMKIYRIGIVKYDETIVSLFKLKGWM